jgi:hypothetical protein
MPGAKKAGRPAPNARSDVDGKLWRKRTFITMTEAARQAFLAHDWSKDTRWQAKLGTIELKEGGVEEFNRAVVRKSFDVVWQREAGSHRGRERERAKVLCVCVCVCVCACVCLFVFHCLLTWAFFSVCFLRIVDVCVVVAMPSSTVQKANRLLQERN